MPVSPRATCVRVESCHYMILDREHRVLVEVVYFLRVKKTLLVIRQSIHEDPSQLYPTTIDYTIGELRVSG